MRNRMRQTVLSVFAAAALVFAAPMAAQHEHPQAANEEQRTTRAHAESWGVGHGHTLTGEIVSVEDDALKVRTTTGIENVVLLPDTERLAELDKGDRVAVDYIRSTQGAIIAQQVRSETTRDREMQKRMDAMYEKHGKMQGEMHGRMHGEHGNTGERHGQMKGEMKDKGMMDRGDWVVGVVTTFDDDSLVVRTDDGTETFIVTPYTRRVVAYKVGDPVAIRYKIGDDRQKTAEYVREGETANEEQRRTRAHHESWGVGQGLTMTGTVVSVEDEALKVKTITGIENVVLTEDTEMMVEPDKGDVIAVDYNRSTQGAIIAEQIRNADVPGIERRND